jgi:hypothetical protein
VARSARGRENEEEAREEVLYNFYKGLCAKIGLALVKTKDRIGWKRDDEGPMKMRLS